MHRLVGVLGMITMMGLAFLFSTNRRAIWYKTVAWGLGLQIVFAFLVMRWQYGRLIFQKAGAAVNWILGFTDPTSYSAIWEKKAPRWDFSSLFRCCRQLFSSPRFLRCCTTTELCGSSSSRPQR